MHPERKTTQNMLYLTLTDTEKIVLISVLKW